MPKLMFAWLGVTALAFVLGSEVAAKTTTLTGRVVDEGCSLKEMKDHNEGNASASHDMDACALECAKRGEPLALLTADGKVYRIAGPLADNKNAKLIEHMNKTVMLSGEVIDKDGKQIISADTIKPAR